MPACVQMVTCANAGACLTASSVSGTPFACLPVRSVALQASLNFASARASRQSIAPGSGWREVNSRAPGNGCAPSLSPVCLGMLCLLLVLLVVRAAAQQCLDQRVPIRPVKEVRDQPQQARRTALQQASVCRRRQGSYSAAQAATGSHTVLLQPTTAPVVVAAGPQHSHGHMPSSRQQL